MSAELGILLDAVEHDFRAVRRDVEVLDDEVARQLAEHALGAALQVDQPQVLVAEVTAQQHQRLAVLQEGDAPCAARQHHTRHRVGTTVGRGRPQRKGRTDVRARVDHELTVRRPGRVE